MKKYSDSSGNPVTESVVSVTDASGNPVTGNFIEFFYLYFTSLCFKLHIIGMAVFKTGLV